MASACSSCIDVSVMPVALARRSRNVCTCSKCLSGHARDHPKLTLQTVSSKASLSRMPSAVRRGNGLVRTSRGNLVKIVTQDAPPAARAWHSGSVKSILDQLRAFWQWCTTVYDPFTGTPLKRLRHPATEARRDSVLLGLRDNGCNGTLACISVSHNWSNHGCCSISFATADNSAGQVYLMNGGQALHPHAPLYRFWNSLLNLNMLYICVLVPLKAGFQVETAIFTYMHILNSVCLFSDIVVSLFVGYQLGQTSDLIERRWLQVLRHYFTYWVLYDVLTSLPWELVLPKLIGKTWITETREVAMAVPLIQILRYVTIAKRRSLFSISSLHMKYSQRNMLSFVLLALVSTLMYCDKHKLCLPLGSHASSRLCQVRGHSCS